MSPADDSSSHRTADDAATASRGRLLMLASVVFFIANSLLVRLLGASFGVDSWLLSTARFAVGLLVVSLPFVPGGRASARALWRNPLLIARGVCGGTSVYVYYRTLAELGAGRATFINNTYIVWGALLATIFLRERLRPGIIAALVLGVGGIGLMVDLAPHGFAVTSSDAWALVGAVLAGIVIVVIRKLHERENTATIFAAQCSWGLLFSAAPSVTGWETPTALAAVLLVLSGVLAAVGQLTMTSAYRLLPVAEGSMSQTLVPLGIGIGSAVIFGEHYTTRGVIGAALILASCLLAARTRPRLTAGLPVAQSSPAATAATAKR